MAVALMPHGVKCFFDSRSVRLLILNPAIVTVERIQEFIKCP